MPILYHRELDDLIQLPDDADRQISTLRKKGWTTKVPKKLSNREPQEVPVWAIKSEGLEVAQD